MSPHCIWIITVGGRVDGVDTSTPVTNPNIAKLTELGQYIMMINVLVFWIYKI